MAKIASDKFYLLNMHAEFSLLRSTEPLAGLNPSLVNSFPDINGSHGTTYPILLDAWNNPIIFVPASGLQITI